MWNPIRRNKNIGTIKQGYGRSNKLIIPNPCVVSKSFYERLKEYEKIEKTINDHTFIFIVEATRESCKHACSVKDIERIIENIPSSDYGSLKLIILRQPTRKEELLSPVWGRLIYSYEFEKEYYPAIIIEAVDYNKKINWSKSQSIDDRREFERLKSDGHQFVESKRDFTASLEIENVRNTQLYRTLPHEIGHYIHYWNNVEKHNTDDEDFEEWNKRDEKFSHIPKIEKEKYANKYADELLKKLEKEKLVPFERLH